MEWTWSLSEGLSIPEALYVSLQFCTCRFGIRCMDKEEDSNGTSDFVEAMFSRLGSEYLLFNEA